MKTEDIATLYQYAVDACYGADSRFYRMQGTLSRALTRRGWGSDGKYSTASRRRTKLYRYLSEQYGEHERNDRRRLQELANTVSIYDRGDF